MTELAEARLLVAIAIDNETHGKVWTDFFWPSVRYNKKIYIAKGMIWDWFGNEVPKEKWETYANDPLVVAYWQRYNKGTAISGKHYAMPIDNLVKWLKQKNTVRSNEILDIIRTVQNAAYQVNTSFGTEPRY